MTRPALAALLLAPALAHAAPRAHELSFDAERGAFDDLGPGGARVGDTVRVRIRSGDPRVRWRASLELADPIGTGADYVVGILPVEITATLGLRGGAELIDATARARAALRAFITAEAATDADLDALAETFAALDAALAAAGGATRGLPLGEGPATRAIADAARSQEAPPVAAAGDVGGAEGVDEAEPLDTWSTEADVAAAPAPSAAREQATALLRLFAQVRALAEEARASRAGGEIAVRRGYATVLATACHQRLVVTAEDGVEKVAWSEERCDEDVYRLPVDNPAGVWSANMGLLALIDGGIDPATIRPTFNFGARALARGHLRAHAGADIGTPVGDGLGRVLTVGAYAGVAGLSLGFGVALDRDAVSDPVLPYLRIGASSDLWPMLKGVAPSGPTTASAASAQAQLR